MSWLKSVLGHAGLPWVLFAGKSSSILMRRRASAFLVALGLTIGSVNGHNLDQRDSFLAFDEATSQLMSTRAGLGQPLLQEGDSIGVVLKSTPHPGTATGMGGYLTFYVPKGTQVLKTEYMALNASGALVPVPIKGESIAPIGSGPNGQKITTELIGLNLGPNVLGVTEAAVTAAGAHRGTIAGVYADTGIFYSTDPRTAFGSWAANGGYDGNVGTNDNTVTNNSGDVVVPTTQWDGEQLLAYGMKAPGIAIVDYGDQRGNSPWGLASGVSGPQTGYAWDFRRSIWLDTATYPSASDRMKAAVSTAGPWQRIKYPGSQAALDQAGLISSTNGYASTDVSDIGFNLTPGTPLPPTTSYTDSTSPKAIRISFGQLELGRAEYGRVTLKVLADPGEPGSPFDANGCFKMYTDAFGGDAGGEQGGKDHLWRYYYPTIATIDTCAALLKDSSKDILAPGENFSYSIKLINSGITALNNVVITDPLPAGVTYVSATPAPNSTGPLVWNLGSVPANSIVTITVNVTATGSGNVFNTATLTSTQVSTTATDSIFIGNKSLLTPEKTVTPSSVSPGGTVTYTLDMLNTGSGPNGSPLVITELLPVGFNYTSMVSQEINGGLLPGSALTINSTNPNRPVFTIAQSINAGAKLRLVFTCSVSGTQPIGIYENKISYSYEGKTLASGPMAPVTVGGARIGDTVWRDWDNDGVQDANEEGIAGLAVQLFQADGVTLITSTTTDANGNYVFPGLNAGTYVVKIPTPPAGYVQTYDLDGIGTANSTSVTVASNEVKLTADFGYRPAGTGSIGDLVFKDVSNDGTFNGADTGIANVTVNLYEDTNSNGVIDTGDALIATTTTDGSGNYLFSGLATGVSYIADVDQTDADLIASFGINPFQSSTSDPHRITNLSGAYTAADFGFWQLQPATIGDKAFQDTNANGVYDSGELAIPELTINIYRDSNGNGSIDIGEFVATTTTDANGDYLFTGLGPDTYLVSFDSADPDIPGGLRPSVSLVPVTVTAGQNVLTADFPFTQLINKTADKTTAEAGNTITYTIVPSYSGCEVLQSLMITDPVPAGTTFVSANMGGTASAFSSAPGYDGVDPGALPPVTLTLNTSQKDTWINGGATTFNYGTATTLAVNRSGGQRSLVQFDLSSIPIGSTVTSATLTLNATAINTTNPVIVHRVSPTALWDEGTANGAAGFASWANRQSGTPWTAAGGDYVTAGSDPSITLALDLNNWTVTDIVNTWVSGAGVTNNGFILKIPTEGGGSQLNSFSSREGATAPRLVVTYTPPPGTQTTNQIVVSPTTVNSGGTVTVTMKLRSNTALSNVAPSALTVSTTNGATATLVSGPTPASQNVPGTNTFVDYTWTYNLTSGVVPGTVVFSGDATNGTYNFFEATSNSAQVTNGGSGQTVTWNLGSSTPADPGSRLEGITIYGFGGAATATFQSYSPDTNTWSAAPTDAPATISKGGALTTDGTNIYALRGTNTTTFYRYNVGANTWTTMAGTPGAVQQGGALVYVAPYIYALRGNNQRSFYRYDIGTNTWSSMATLVPKVGAGGSLTTDGTYIYALIGNGGKLFYRYDIAGDTWTALAPVAGNVSSGGSLAFDGSTIYAFRGNNSTTFWAYNRTTNVWTTRAVTPATVGVGGSLIYSGGSLYAYRGNSSTTVWRYSASANAWSTLAVSPVTIGDGGALVPFGTPSAYTVELNACPTLVMHGNVATVTMKVGSSAVSMTGVTPPSLSVNTTGGASATLASGPIPATANITAGGTATFTWTYTVTSDATTPGTVKFTSSTFTTGTPAKTFPAAVSNSVITSRPLTMTVTVDNGTPEPVVNNTATISTNEFRGCYFVANKTSGTDSDRLIKEVNGVLSDVALTGTTGMKALAMDPDGVTLWGVDKDAGGPTGSADRIGTVNTTTGAFTAVARSVDGTNTLRGSLGTFTSATIVAIAFDPVSGNILAVGRREDATAGNTLLDILYQIDPITGLRVVDAFGAGVDYVAIDTATLPTPLYDIGDFAFDPASGNLYAVANDSTTGFGDQDRLVTIDPTTGVVTDVARIMYDGTGLNDVQGMSFKSDGSLEVTTGDLSGTGKRNSLFSIDLATAVAELEFAFTSAFPSYTDYEAVACIDAAQVIPSTNTQTTQTALTGSIGDTVYVDLDGDGVQDPGEPPLSGVQVCATNGVTTLCDVTDGFGTYHIFGLTANGGNPWTVTMDLSSIPAGYTPTTATVLSVVLPTNVTQYVDADFGVRPPPSPAVASSIGDTLWIDADEDGVVDLGEAPLPNITVNLYQDVNNDGAIDAGDLLVGTAVTNASGQYLFGSLYAGNYLVDVDEADPDMPAGTERVSGGANGAGLHDVTLPAATNYLTADFGYNYSGSIGDTVFYDTDQDGIQDVGENGAPGGTVMLYGDINANGAIDIGEPILALATTDANGAYLFDNLPAGSYIVKVDEQTFAAPAGSPNAGTYGGMQGTTGTKRPVTLAAAQDYLLADVGLAEVAKLEGYVFHDVNHNGVLEPGETGLANVTVTLTGFDLNNVPVTITTTTDAAGKYKFLVPSGSYTITYNTSDPDIPANLSTTTTPTSINVAPMAGEEVNGLDFGRDDAGIAGDLVFADLDGDGVRDAGEPGLDGVTVVLYAADGVTFLASTNTDTNGAYSFIGLADGNYVIEVLTASLPGGYNTTPTADPDAPLDSKSTAVIVGGGSDLTNDFGYQPTIVLRTISGTIFNDLNTNGTANLPAEALAGVTVTAAVDTNNDTIPDQTFTTTTDANGFYSFSAIPDGSDIVVTVNTATLPNTAFVNTVDPDVTINSTTTISNIAANVINQNFGYEEQLGSIAGTVVEGDGDGLAEVGEPALQGVTVTLLYGGLDNIIGTGDDQTFTTTTNASGDYSFTGLLPGVYQITETNPAFYTSIADADGFNPDIISLTLAVGANVVDRDFEDKGNRITGHVYFDTNGNGIQDVGESDLANVDVVITKSDLTTVTVSTDASGNWTALVPPGSTTVNVDETDPDFLAVIDSAFVLTEGTDPTTVTAIAAQTVSAGNDGYFMPATITGSVLADTDNDDIGDLGLSGIVLTLLDGSGAVIDGDTVTPGVQPITATTNGSGVYSFTNLPPGTYQISEAQPAGYASIGDRDGGNLDIIGDVVARVLDPGEIDTSNDFIEEQYGSITGTVLADTDNNDTGDAPLAGVVLTLLDSSGAVIDGDTVTPGVQPITATTDGSGVYTFSNVPPGDYRVGEAQPSGYQSVSDKDGGNLDQIGDVTLVVVTAGAASTGNHFVEEQLGTISGTVAAGASPLQNVSMALFSDPNGDGDPADGAQIGSAVLTDASGAYTFMAVAPGNYVVVQTQPSGYVSVSDGDVSTPGDDAANVSILDNRVPVGITAGETDDGNNFIEGCPTITVNPATLPNGVVGTAYSETLTGSGGTAPYSFAVTSGSLPAGLTLSGGVISGTPTSTTGATFTITATDALSCTGTRSYTVTPVCPTITVNPASLPGATVGVAYSQTLSGSGGTAPYTFAVTTGTLPSGLTLSGGVISGTTTATGSSTFTITATDNLGCAGTRSLTITSTCPAITVNPATLPNGVVGTAYSEALSATNGTAPYTYAVSSGVLPAGLTLTGATIGGTPTSTTSQTFTITATDANGCTGTLSFTVAPACPVITVNPATLPDGTVNTAYNETVSATGGIAPYNFAVTIGTLPAGLSMTAGGVISGTPTSPTSQTFTITVTDANSCTGARSFTVAPACPTITVNPATLPNGTVNAAYNQTVTATGGIAPYTFAVTTGTLPAGLSMTNAGVISGTPTSTTSQTFTITATDANSCTGALSFTVAPACPAITVNPATLPNGTVNAAYNQTVSATGGIAPYTFAVTTGTLPTGLSMTNAGVISGTPTSTTSQTFTITATDANSCTGTLSFTVAPACPTITVSPVALANGVVGTAYSETLSATGGVGPYTYAVTTGVLPTGLSLGGDVISGTPTATTSQTFTITATDANSCTGTRTFTVAPVCPTVTVTPATLPNGVVGTAYSQTLGASGGTAPYTYAVTTGVLPAGLALSTDTISGTPTATTSQTFTITATDANGCAGTLSYTIAPVCPTISLSSTPAVLPSGTIGVPYSGTINASGGTAAYTFAVKAGSSLPPGLSISGAGAISGTPTINGTTSTIIVATDANGCTGEATFTINIGCATLSVTPATVGNGVVGTAYTAVTFSSTGGTNPITWTQTGTLPAGMTFNTVTATLEGTPTAAGTFNITVIATDANTCAGSVSLTFSTSCPAITVNPAALAAATVGTAYSETLSATGGTSPYTFAVTSGTLPAGLALSGATISGTPTATTSQTFTITATDANGCTGTRSFTLAPVCPTITVTPATLPNGVVGTAYSQTLGATNGTAPYTYAVTSGVLPAGLSLTGDTINGTPTSTTAATFTITTTDTHGCTGTRTFTVTPACPTITVTPATLPDGVVGTAYSQTLGATNGTAPYTYAVTSGALPAGLSLSGSTISGTPTSTTAATFTITATDTYGCTGSLSFTVTPVCPAITVNPATLPDATVGSAYSQTLSATGGTSPYTYAVTTGTLPTGLALSGDTISGTSTVAGSVTFTITATDANGCSGTRSLTIMSTCPAITVSPATLANGVVGTAYSETLSATGGVGPYTYAVTTGVLPTGLSLTGDVISGTPTATTSQTFTITITDANGCEGTRTFTVAPTCPTISLSSTPAVLPSGTIGVAYSGTINASGGTPAYTFAVKAGSSLPPGLSIDGAGAISGTPTINGTTSTIIVATDANGCTGEATFTINVGCNTLAVAPSSLSDGVVGTAYTPVTFSSTGGANPITWTQTGTLPAGMTFNTVTATLEGTPTAAGSFNITVTATDANTCAGSVSLTFSTSCPTVTVSPATLPDGVVGAGYAEVLSASGGTAPYTFAVTTGSLPAGLTLTGDTINGTPTSTTSATFIVTATDANGCTGTRTLTIASVCPTITVNPATLPNGVVGTAYSQVLSASGGTTPYTIAVTSGALPAGLSLSAGVISGTPTSTAAATFTLTATDANGCSGTRSFTLTPLCPTITVSPSSLPNATVGSAYNQTLSATGGTAPYNYAVTTGALPAGLTLTGDTISGTATAAGSSTFTITATDANGCAGTRSLSISSVCPSVTVTPSSLPAATVGVSYVQPLNASGGTSPYSFAVTAGTLPAGLTLTGDTINGTPTSSASATFTITATDANGCAGTRTFTIAPVCPTITITPVTLPDGVAGEAYSEMLFASGGSAPYTYAVTTGVLPAGLTLTGDTISGTPTSTVSRTFIITATDANGCTGARTFTIAPTCPTISLSSTPAVLPSGTIGVPYSGTINASGGMPAYTFAVKAGSNLPAGLSMDSAGVISGTPTTNGTENTVIVATDANGCEGEATFTINIGCATLSVTPGSLSDGVVGTPYTPVTFNATGGLNPITWSQTGTLPAGMTFNPATATLSGTPASDGTFSITIIATDANSCSGSVNLTFSTTCPAVTVNPASLPDGVVNAPYSQTLTAVGGMAPHTFAVAGGSLPAGLSLSGGVISGTPATTAGATFVIRATDANGCAGTRNFTITPACPTITVNPAVLAGAVIGEAYNEVLSATGGVAPYTFTLASGSLPDGLSLIGDTIDGTPTAAASHTFTILVTDDNGCTGVRTFTLAPACPTITVSPATLPDGVVGAAYNEMISASGGNAPYTFAVTSGSLPAGLSLSGDTISGTPTSAANATFTITATDAFGCTGTRALSIDVLAGTVTGHIYLDENGNGTQDIGEPDLANVDVIVEDSNGNFQTVSTNATGDWTAVVPAGITSANVDENDPDFTTFVLSGYVQTEGDDPTSVTAVANVTTLAGIDGYFNPASITGSVLADTDNDDIGDSAISGVMLTLLDGSGAVIDGDTISPGVQPITATTDLGGFYSFTGLAPGTYQIAEAQPSGYASIGDRDGGDLDIIGDVVARVLNPGATDAANDFVEEQYGSISGTVLADTDNDDVGDTPISGVVMTLLDISGAVVDGDSLTPGVQLVTATTDVNGDYLFDNVLPGNYRVGEAQPSGYQSISDADGGNLDQVGDVTVITLLAGTASTGNDFVEEELGEISGTVFADTNNDDAGDVPMQNVALALFSDPNGDGNPSDGAQLGGQVFTDVNGIYTFSGIAPGSYVVVQTQPGGYLTVTDGDSTTPNDDASNVSTTDDLIPVAITAGEIDDGNRFVEEQRGTVSGHLYIDTNGNGIQDVGEPDLANVDLLITDSTGATQIVATNSNGDWSATVPPGNTTANVQEADPQYPAGATQTEGSDPTVVAAAAGVDTDAGIDGFFIPGSITGAVLTDTDNDNLGEDPIPGVILTLLDASGAVIDGDPLTGGVQPITATTDNSGVYSFTGLAPGTYRVSEAQPAGYLSLSDRDGGDLDQIGDVTLITVTAGMANLGNDFLEELAASVGNIVWDDTNNNGIKDPGENGIDGVLVELLDGSGDPIDSDPLTGGVQPTTTTTAGGGFYAFTQLHAGDYSLRISTPPVTRPVSSTTTDPNDNGEDNDDNGMQSLTGGVITSLVFTLSAGEDDQTIDFGLVAVGSLGNLVWNDVNDDGVKDVGENGIDGVSIALLDSAEIFVDDPNIAGLQAYIVTTSGGGLYSFVNLPPGDYKVRISTPPAAFLMSSGTTDTNDNQQDNDDNGIQSMATAPVTSPLITLTSGETDNTLDFGFTALAGSYSISGQVRDDYDFDGVFSDSDQPVALVSINLYADTNGNGFYDPGTDVLVRTTQTDGLGTYLFTGIADGGYFIEEVDPDGSTSTADTQGNNDNLITVVIAGGDSLGNDFLDAVDPSGYIYHAVTGQIIAGGAISVSGPGNITILMDGSTGQYSFLVDTAGTYTITYSPPLGYMIDPSRPVAGASFDPTGGPDPTVLGSSENPGNPGYLTNFSAAGNPYYLVFDLAPGDPFVINNNIPLVEIKPTTFAGWQYGNPLGGQNGPAQNPDGDRFDNLQEYAFCYTPDTGVSIGCPLKLIVNADGTVDAQVRRAANATDITYTLEYIADISGSGANGAGWTNVTTIVPTVVNNGDGTETVTYQDLATLPGLIAGKGFVRIRVDLDANNDTVPEQTSRTLASGWDTRALTVQCQTVSMPFFVCDIFSGSVDSVAGSVLNVATSAGTGSVSGSFVSGKQYYIEVLSGDNAGHRFDVDEAASTATTLAIFTGAGNHNTLTSIPTNLATDVIAVRQNLTLDDVFVKSKFTATNNQTTADRLLFFNSTTGTFSEIYWLYLNGGVPKWVLTTDAGLADRGGRVIDPCEAMFAHCRTSAVNRILSGHVRQNSFACPLKAGSNLIGSGFPMDQSPAMRVMTFANGFTGGRDPRLSDQIRFWSGDTTTGLESYVSHFLVEYNTLHQWSPQYNASLVNENNLLMFKSLQGAFIKSIAGHTSWIIPTPWTP